MKIAGARKQKNLRKDDLTTAKRRQKQQKPRSSNN
jgi:hypothetical protein